MTTAFYFCCDFLYMAVRIWISFDLIAAMAEPRYGKKAELMLRWTIVVGIAGINTYNHTVITALFSNTMLLLIMLAVVLVAKVAYQCQCQKVWMIIFYFWMGLAMLDLFIQTLAYHVLLDCGVSGEPMLTTGIVRGIYLLLCTIAATRIGSYIRLWLADRRNYIGRLGKQIYLFAVLLVICLVYFQRIYRGISSEQVIRYWEIFILLTILLLLVGGIYKIRQREREQALLQQQKIILLESNYHTLSQVYEEKSVLLHDMRKHLGVIYGLAAEDRKPELLDYIAGLDGKLSRYKTGELSNHKLLDLILNVKRQEAEDEGIDVQYELDDMGGLKMDSTDICALFSNLLDNAIEANRKRDRGAGRWLKLSCIRKGRMVMITASNPMTEACLVLADGLPRTTKKDTKLHGFGMLSIRQVAETYGGYLDIQVKDKTFHVVIYLEGFRA